MAGGEDVGQVDAVLLAPLTEDTFLHNLHIRYKRDIIYTAVADALVSLNPCRTLPLYSAELAREYLARAPHLLPPHVYAVAAAALRWVRDRNESQCIVITGESGAGKTEAARVCLQCVALAGAGGVRGAGAALAAAGTLLEAFGNAATARNHNASRFGKLLEVELGVAGEPLGGHVTHYLLEKERAAAAAAAAGERNFHVLYQLLAGAEPYLLKRLRLQRSWEHYRILRAAGASPRRTAPRDRDHFAFTMAAMEALGLGGEDGSAVLRLLAFVLKLGNVEFEPQHNIDGTMGASPRPAHELAEACALVGVADGALAEALCAAGAECAAALRDRLVCALYARLFTWLVGAVNAALRAPAAGARAALGILDMYGFESLAHNGLERLLINYAAERVQAAVAGAAPRREQELYAAEGVPWRALPYADHEQLADLLDAGPASVLGALHECAVRGASDAAFLHRLARRRHPRLRVLPPDRFQVAHFGGAVQYCARGLVAHERDALCGRCADALATARDPLLAALFAAPRDGSPRRPATLSWRQRALLSALVRRLPPAPRLLRCLRAAPPPEQRPQHFDAAYVRRQLRDQGIVEMALLRRSGWCESMCARAALARYGVLGDTPASSGGETSPVRAARALLRALPIPGAEFAFGRTRVFIRSPRTVWELEALRAARVHALVASAQRAWRRHRARRRAAAAATIARAWLAHRSRAPAAEGADARAAARLWRWWCAGARRRYLTGLWRRLPARHMSPACVAWPPCPWPQLLGRTDELLRRLHHAWRCRLYRAAFDQTARNRMREKVTASVLFKGRKLSYARSVPHPFVGDYVRLRASAAWLRGPGAEPRDRYVVFADVVGKVARASGRVSRCLCVVSTGALLLLEAHSLRLKRRVPAHAVYRLSLSPLHDDLLVVHVRASDAPDTPPDEASQWSARDAAAAAGCLSGGEGARRRGDVVVRACHALELATKLFLVVQNAAGAPPHVHIAAQFEANFGQELVTVSVHAVGIEGGARLLRRGSRLDVLV